jgi:hypothetical protein
MWAWLMSLDAPTRAAIITSAATMLSVLGALVGVFGTIGWNRRQHRDERSLSLRRDIYLNAIDVINRASSFATSQVNPLKADKEGKEKDKVTAELYGVCAKLHILGTRCLVSAVIAFQTEFDEWLTKVNRHNRIVPEIDNLQHELFQHIKGLQGETAKFTTESNEIVKLANEFKINPDDKEGSKKRGQEIVKLAEEFAKRKTDFQVKIDRLIEEKQRFAERRFTHIGQSLQFLTSIPKRLSPIIDEITIAMKSELGLPVDEDWYKGETKKSLDNVLKVADGWIEKLDVTDEQRQWIRAGAYSDFSEKPLN